MQCSVRNMLVSSVAKTSAIDLQNDIFSLICNLNLITEI